MSKNIECTVHGVTEGCILCSHLRNEENLGYARIDVDSNDDYTSFLCEECESVLLEDEGWTDRLTEQADFQIYCKECALKSISKHTLVAEGKCVD